MKHININLLICCVSPGIDKPYLVFGGLFRKEAIMLLRRFYIQENEKGIVRRAFCTLPD